MKERLKNIWMWLGLIGIVFASANIPFESLTSWPILLDSLSGIIMNPFQLSMVVAAVVGVIVNPTTPGLND